MAKGQKRGNREIKKPKASGKKLAPASTVAGLQPPARPLPTKGNAK